MESHAMHHDRLLDGLRTQLVSGAFLDRARIAVDELATIWGSGGRLPCARGKS